MEFEIIIGSTSDQDKIVPGIERFVGENPDWKVKVTYASADNTPEKAATAMVRLTDGDSPGVLESGAGMANLLTGVYKTHARITDLVVGIPIGDSFWDGLSSVLSTVEKPPRNPVLGVGLNNTYAALNIAKRVLEGYDPEAGVTVAKYDDESADAVAGIQKKLDHYGIANCVRGRMGIDEDSVVITPFMIDGANITDLDAKLREGKGIQIGVCYAKPDLDHPTEGYVDTLSGTEVTGIVTAGNHGYTNSVLVAAQILGHQGALEKLAQEKVKKFEDLNGHKGLLITAAGVQKL